jgi:hypothetical protein
MSRGIVVFSEDAVDVLEFVPCPRRAAVLNLQLESERPRK